MRTLDFEDMWKYAKIKGYETYVMEVTTSDTTYFTTDTVPILLLTHLLAGDGVGSGVLLAQCARALSRRHRHNGAGVGGDPHIYKQVLRLLALLVQKHKH